MDTKDNVEGVAEEKNDLDRMVELYKVEWYSNKLYLFSFHWLDVEGEDWNDGYNYDLLLMSIEGHAEVGVVV